NSALDLLGWDEQVNLPKKSAAARASQSSALSDLIHRESIHPQVDDWLNALEQDPNALTTEQQCVVQEARRNFDRAVKLPSAFVARRAEHQSRAYHAWVEARKNDDFVSFAPFLKTQLELAREEAGFFGLDGLQAYDYHIDNHDPGMTASVIGTLFDSLKSEIVPLVKQILSSAVKPNLSMFKGFPIAQQEAFLKRVTASLGFDYDRGRLDVAVHPFCSGNGEDTRLTTRYFVDNPLDSLFSSIHETGHGLYEQGLPLEHLGTGLGTAAGMGVHESQSRIWENQVARSRSFWDYWEPFYREAFPEQLSGVTSEQLYLAVNGVSLNPIRVDSDEVTYNLHIILRFELEKCLFSGELDVVDLPAFWNEKAEKIIGLRPTSDVEGVLQDVHWSSGAFGYFPSYCLGNMLAAQLWYSALDALPGIEIDFSNGDFTRLLSWLREKVHCEGKRCDLMNLTKKVTGKELSSDSLIRYLKERYLPLYQQT
ncbi:MAG TPA: carboxypeptidase M32, partial [Verrucomicrobia bacterium]|nr:carboxypeptidase M32 [Verrucomicrobiota bacterium]